MFFRKKIDFDPNDQEGVIRACIAGSERAQRALFKQYFSFAKSICLRYTSSAEEAEEVLNEGFLKVFANLERFDTSQPFKGWLRTILVNTAISYYRKHQKHYKDTVSLEDAAIPRFSDDILENITAVEILDLVQQIKPVYRTVFLMYAVDGYSHKEIAEVLKINETAVRSNYVRARARLQHLIYRNYPDLFPKGWFSKTLKQNEN